MPHDVTGAFGWPAPCGLHLPVQHLITCTGINVLCQPCECHCRLFYPRRFLAHRHCCWLLLFRLIPSLSLVQQASLAVGAEGDWLSI